MELETITAKTSPPHSGAVPAGHADALREEDAQKPHGGLRKFLVVADGSPESKLALLFASQRARVTGSYVSLLCIMDAADFQHWMSVEALMKEEARADAESILYEMAGEVNRVAGLVPELIIREGPAVDAVKKLIAEDPHICILVLGAAAGKDGPGPLVSSAAACTFGIPVTIVPGNLTPEAVEDLA